MNSLRTLQALNQVVNHDICPQMKALIAENKRLVKKNNKCLKLVKSAKALIAENNELSDWKDYMLHMEYFRCEDCKNICAWSNGDDYDEHNNSVRCEDCVTFREEAEEVISFTTPPPPPALREHIINIFINERPDMDTDTRFAWDADIRGYKFVGGGLIV
tara:strand:- start:13 stop:492 length:480 start_codon:yes stop_codon:yes gene_type:complete